MEKSMELLNRAMDVRYIKLRFNLRMLEDCIMPASKTSAIRGGFGEMLLRANCISDRKCESCMWEDECIVQRTMYSKFDHKPSFITQGESIGYIVECDDYREHFSAGDTWEFCLVLFGKTIVYFNQYLQALAALGQSGIGKDNAVFSVERVRNTYGEDILKDNNIYMSRYRTETISDYAAFRKHALGPYRARIQMNFHTAAAIKYHGELLNAFNPEAIVKSIQRRLYLLDCFEAKEDEEFYQMKFPVPELEKQTVHPVNIRRYSNRREQAMWMSGIKGNLQLSNISEETWNLLLAGELLHVGKNTSFGFGQYRIMK